LALRNGISYEEFCAGLRRVYVETVREDFEIPGSEMTRSRVAILTGLSRSEVRQVEEEIERGFGDELVTLAMVGKLVEGWTSDGEFTGPYGIPLELKQEEGHGNFPALVNRYGGTLNPAAMLRELKRIGLAEETKGRKVRLLSRSYIAGRFRPEAIDRMGRALGDLADTLEHNLNPFRHGPPRFERHVYTPDGMDEESFRLFQIEVDEAGQDFLERLDNWISEKEQEGDRKVEKRLLDPEVRQRARTVKVGVGVYLYEHRDEAQKIPSDGDHVEEEI
jgi:hypothetical protein